MDDRLTHASFFSGVGGLDMGLERAGWRTVSFSEIDPYASAVLAERWPGVPNLGDIVELAGRLNSGSGRDGGSGEPDAGAFRRDAHGSSPAEGDLVRLAEQGGRADAGQDGGDGTRHGQSGHWHHATLWTGGFPCQDLSVAGKRRGMGAGTRSGLAYAFLDLVGRHHPRFVLLENVPGLLSSHGGRDMAALTGALVELGYGVGYRVLDARYFGVPQRRRRVFILGDSLGGRAGAERAAEVLSVGSRCPRHPPTGIEAGPGVAAGTSVGTLNARMQSAHNGQDDYAGFLIGSSPDPDRMRAADGLAGRSHDPGGLANAVRASDGHHGYGSPRGDGGDNLVAFSETAATLLSPNGGPRTTDLSNELVTGGGDMTADPLLPLGLDSHRYRCCGNGVVADVAFWIGLRLAAIA